MLWSSASVYGIFMFANSVRVGACSTILPAYITAMSSVCPATTPEVVRDEDQRHVPVPPLLADEVEDLRLHRHVERRGRLVGEHQRRAARHRERDHHALAHATAQLERVLVEPLLGLGDATSLRSRSDVAPSIGLAHSEVQLQPSRAACRCRITGCSDVIGSWKIIDISLPQILRRCFKRQVDDLLTLEDHGPGAHHVAAGQETMIERARTVLPSPTPHDPE
jgi:hypothetical protein